MRNLPVSISQELHRLSTDGALVCLLAINRSDPDWPIIDDDGTIGIYRSRSFEDLVWTGYGAGTTWKKFWFEIDTLEENTSGSIPELTIVTSNIGGFVEKVVIDNDNFEESTCTIYLVNTNCLNETDPIFSMEFDIKKPIVNRMAVSLNVAAENPLLFIYPSWHVHGSVCQYRKFGLTNGVNGFLCGYAGGYPLACNRSLMACRGFGNSDRFGAQISLRDETWELDES
jgi:hypothetical protein